MPSKKCIGLFSALFVVVFAAILVGSYFYYYGGFLGTKPPVQAQEVGDANLLNRFDKPDLSVASLKSKINKTINTNGYAYNRDGSVDWDVFVEPGFSESSITEAGGKIKMKWPEGKIITVSSAKLNFGDVIVTKPFVKGAVPNSMPKKDNIQAHIDSAAQKASSSYGNSGVTYADGVMANGPDVYKENGQWWLYAVGAAEPVASTETVSGWTPQWKLDYEGEGVTVGIADTGIPSQLCEPVEVLADANYGMDFFCSFFGLPAAGDQCYIPGAGQSVDLCVTNEEAGFNFSKRIIDGVTYCVLPDFSNQSLQALVYNFFGIDIYDQSSGYEAFFVPHKLHPEFDWFVPGDGGVLPVFQSRGSYADYYRNRYFKNFIPGGFVALNQLLDENRIPLRFTMAEGYAESIQDGAPGECPTWDPRLPDPDSLAWKPYSYTLGDQPIDKEGWSRVEGANGYDSQGELRVIVSDNTGFDNFDMHSGHGTMVAGIIGARHKMGEGEEYMGAMRGLAPKAKIIAYPQMGGGLFGRLNAWRRAEDDGVRVLSNSFYGYYYGWELEEVKKLFTKWKLGGSDMEYQLQLVFLGLDEALKKMGPDILILNAAGNFAWILEKDIPKNAVFVNWSGVMEKFLTLIQSFAGRNSLIVGGTAPRDYDWRGSIPEWMPNASGEAEKNLDRPMAWIDFGNAIYGGTGYGSLIDVVAPGGSFDTRPCEAEQTGQEGCYFKMLLNNGVYTTNNGSFWNSGLHDWVSGTSFSTPIAAGVAALAADAYKDAHGVWPTAAQLKNIVMRSADDKVGPSVDEVVINTYSARPEAPMENYSLETLAVDKPGEDDWMGAGRVNAYKAIQDALKNKD